MSAAAGASAAAAIRRRMEQEEEEMTPYQAQDLSGDWELKILRSVTGTFGKARKLKEILDHEAQAGWTLFEKLDDRRIRLKRPVSARSGDGALGFDPYRTYVGMSEAKFSLALVVVILGVTLLVTFVLVASLAPLIQTFCSHRLPP
jgi:hypothetical protein